MKMKSITMNDDTLSVYLSFKHKVMNQDNGIVRNFDSSWSDMVLSVRTKQRYSDKSRSIYFTVCKHINNMSNSSTYKFSGKVRNLS